ncbi:alkaline phosphatase family protein [Halobellus ordinarius]|uniref:alkaline phosphatase family protein n=1 Tax=Halobellus ordinarius TaxID=3075120 RepID=UPI0028808BAE|nr:alkaline phosphatase family protein [Halobellus sp. ZY16]
MKLLVIGWDGASHRHLDKFDLPYWDSLDHNGKLLPSELFHRATYISSANAWTTMTTGASFEEHEILGFVYGKYSGHPLSGAIRKAAMTEALPTFFRRVLVSEILGRFATDGGRMAKDHIQSTDVGFKRVWEMLPGQSLVFGLPLTYPVPETDGILVSGIPAPTYEEATQPLVAPQALESTVYSEDFSGYYVDLNSPVHDSTVSEANYTDAHLEKSERIVDTYLDLYNNEMTEDPEFGFLMLRSIDDLLHATDDETHIQTTYEKIDALTERLVDEIDPDNVLILSDHGMRPTSFMRVDSDLRMDHDTREGVWGGTTDFGISRQSDVTPSILEHFGEKRAVPVNKDSHELESSRSVDGTAVHERLEDLGYA